MTAELLRAALGLIAIAAGGAGLSAALGASPAFAFPAGLVLLQAFCLALAPRFFPHAALVVLGLAALLVARSGRSPPAARPSSPAHISLPLVAVALLSVQAVLLFTVALHDPWIDSDAANHHRWVGLAKLIREQRLPAGPRGDPLGPSLATAFIAALFSRWRDQAASLLWFTVWIAIAWLALAITARVRSRGLAGILVCAFATLPLLTAHVVRPGFAEALLTLFLLAGLALLERDDRPLDARGWTLLAVFATGLAMTKLEGKAWAAWLLLAALTRDLAARGRLRWNGLAAIWAAAGALLLGAHLALGERLEPAAGTADDRMRWIYEHHWAPRAMLRFAADALSASSFGVLWWWSLFAAAWLLLRSREDRGWVLVCSAPIAAAFYFCCVTGNIPQTLSGTDVSRFLLQLSPIALALLCRWARRFEEAAGESRRPAEDRGGF